MAIARNPKRNTNTTSEKDVQAFISGAARPPDEGASGNKKPILIRVDPDMLARIDHGAKRLGISRSAFIVSSAAEKLERME